MFGRKKRDRIISDWPALQDALVGNFDAEETGRALEALGPERVTLAGHSEEPE